jgi:hypothetical protein
MDNNKKQENIYDVSTYSEKELYNLLDLNNPSDRELEAKIIFMIKKYNNIQNKSGDQLAAFFTDIYNHFFDNEEENEKTEQENILIEKEDTEIIEGFDTNPKPIQSNIVNVESTKNVPPENGQKDTSQQSTIGFIKPLDYAPDQLNPLLNQTTKRIISIDSQYRDDKTSMPTEFTFNLSSPLKDVVSLKLYSVHIPYTWYTISKSFGSNFFYFKGNVPGILNNPNHYIFFDILPGNYNAEDLILTVNDSITRNKSVYTDVSFGNTKISYNKNTTLASFNIDINKQYNENSYYLNFENYVLQKDFKDNRNTSIPSFLGFNNQIYQLNTINSSITLPLDINNPFYTAQNFIITSENNYFTIIKYISNYNSNNNTVDDYNKNSTVELSFKITLSGLEVDGQYSRNDIINDLSNQLHNCSYLSSESFVQRYVYEQSYNAYYQMKIKPSRYTTKNVSNSKIFVKFPDETIIWTGPNSCFRFTSIDNEINTIIAETSAVAQTIDYSIVGYPQIILTCSSENFVSPLNDIYITIQPSSNNKSYTLQQYITAINTGIVNSTKVTPFLKGPQTTSYNYIYKPNTFPNYSYSYIDDNDVFKLFLKINKTFDQNMYKLDLSGTYLYKTLYLGNDFNGSQVVTINDTIAIKGYVNNQQLTIIDGTLPKVDTNKVSIKISFDISGQTFGNKTKYINNEKISLGNINLSKIDNDYININNNWSLISRTHVVTETTYKVTCNSFRVPENTIIIPSNIIDVSSSGFSISEGNIQITSNYVPIPSIIENIYFNKESIIVNGSNLTVNGNKWDIIANTWTSDENNNWTIDGNIFLTNDTSWNITNSIFTVSNYGNMTPLSSITLSGDSLTLSGNNYNVIAKTNNYLNINYNGIWNATGSDYNFVNNLFTLNTRLFSTISTDFNIIGNAIYINNEKINVNGANLNVSGNNLLFSGNTLSPTISFVGIGNRLLLNDNNYNIIGNTITYSGNSININPSNVEIINNNMNITGEILSISGDNLLTISKPDYILTGNLLLINSKFKLERNVSVISNSLLLNHNGNLNLNITNKKDITIIGTSMILNGVDIDVNGHNWDVSCELITTYDPNAYQNVDTAGLQKTTTTSINSSQQLSTTDIINNTNSTVTSTGYLNYNYTLFKNIKFKGNNIYSPFNKIILSYATTDTISANITGDVSSNSLMIQSTNDGMQVDISQCTIFSSDLIYITTTGTDINNKIFSIDASYININNLTKEFSIYGRSITYPSTDGFIFTYDGKWTLSGKNISLFTNTSFTIGSTIYDNSTIGPGGIVLGDGVLQINSDEIIFNDVSNFFSGNIDFIKGYDMFLNSLDTLNNPKFIINKGSITLNSNVILIDNKFNSPIGSGATSTGGIGALYLSNNYNTFKINGDTLQTPITNNYKITSTNQLINYTISAKNINIIGNNLSITNNIFSIYGNIFLEQTDPNKKSVNINCLNNIIVNNINYLTGNKDSILGPIETNSSNISVSNKNSTTSDITISGSTTDLKDDILKVIGNINITNNSYFTTKFSNNDYPTTSIALSSPSFNLTNNDPINNLTISGENINFNGNEWNSYGNLLTISQSNNWIINSTQLYVQDQSFTILESNITLPESNFSIPGNSILLYGNNITIPGNTFISNTNIILNTTSNFQVDVSISTYNIFNNNFLIPDNTISWDNNDFSNNNVTWTCINKSGFHLDQNSIINTSASTTQLMVGNVKISAKGPSNYVITDTSLSIISSQYDIANGGNITFIGKTYSSVNIPTNLGSRSVPHDFSINVVYNKTYLPLTNLSSNSNYLAPYSIPNGSTILKIFPRFSSPDSVFGNENDVSYNVINDTGNDIICKDIIELEDGINSLFELFKDKNGNIILSGSKISINFNQTDPNNTTIDSELNLVLNKIINNNDYAIEFSNYIDTNNNKYETWKPNLFINPEFVDISYGLINNNDSIIKNTEINQTTINGTTNVQTINIILQENINNKLTFTAYEDGTISNDVTITVPVYENGREILYSRDGLIKTINNLLSTTIAKGSYFSTIKLKDITYVQLKSNINLIYTSENYNLVFYDTISFVSCYVGAKSVKNTTWDTTIGWILGFRNNSIYNLSQYITSTGEIIISGDTGVCTNLFNYFLLCIDDYTQNHLNDGLVTITSTDRSVPLPSYANRTNFICNPVTKELTYNNANTNDYSKLTQNQIYSITEIANSQNTSSSNLTKGVSSSSFGTGPYVKDIFGLVPIKVSGLSPGSTYIEFGGTLQNQERVYFGPVNIHRMSVKLITDRGDVVDLNEVNWSFSLLCEQLYKPRPSK